MAERVWSVKDALDWTVEYLSGKGIEQPRLSAEWLLSAATGLSRIEVYAFHDRPLSPDERTMLREGVRLRAQGTPLQYVTGEVAFHRIVVRVRPGVFIPRPETEVLVEEALASIRGIETPVVVDLCTGSGCIALSIAHDHPGAVVYATELSSEAAAVARENAERLGFADRVSVLEGDLFAPLPSEIQGRVDLVVSNPPYIPSGDLPDLPGEVLGFEPHLALDGGSDGLDVARRIMDVARTWLAPGGGLFMELDETRVADAAKALSEWYEGCSTVKDLTGRDRIAAGRLL